MSGTAKFIQQRQEVFRYIPGFDIEAVARAKVMVIGAGALGNEVLKNLALLNIGYVVIVDFDVVEPSNLSRSVLFREADCDGKTLKSLVAARRIRELNPSIKINVINGDIAADVGLGVFRRMDVIIGCLDNILARQSVNRAVFKIGKSWIDGGLDDTSGSVASYRNGHACYECSLSKSDRELIRQRFSCPDKIRRYASVGRMPTTPINASIIGALQVQQAMYEINGITDQDLLGKKLKFFGGINEMLITNMMEVHEPHCFSNDEYPEIIESDNLRAEMSVGDFLKWARSYFETENVTLRLDDEFVTSLMSEQTGAIFTVGIPRLSLDDQYVERFKQSDEDVIHIKDIVYEVDDHFPDQLLTLKEIGIPHLHIVNVLVDGDDKYVELTGDEAFLEFT
ncbi:MAG: ThiF family adenylyltransferase [Saprospiraceae bacterium]